MCVDSETVAGVIRGMRASLPALTHKTAPRRHGNWNQEYLASVAERRWLSVAGIVKARRRKKERRRLQSRIHPHRAAVKRMDKLSQTTDVSLFYLHGSHGQGNAGKGILHFFFHLTSTNSRSSRHVGLACAF